MTAASLPSRPNERRRLLGLRDTPGRLALGMFRLPLVLYRHNRGWLLGRTFMLFVHTGRRTGKPHETVAMVLADDAPSAELVICAAWGPNTDWVRNLQAGPAIDVRIARDRFTPTQRFLTDEEAIVVAEAFRARHPHRLRLISAVLGWGDLDNREAVKQFVHTHPFIAFRRAPTP